ncbi:MULTISPECIES: 1-deoxy-D-xylulose-5-phosphate synthase [Aminobacterium]|uniref:1-deoxy-D-xylulose-5-phosphate synthase n=1 Tax=Aminobacterium TaxID=81466 RepID=UPI00257D1AE1|nr:1-deoxy-D-xylulose-5-phosphate synthase [Aminobacterium sp. UBA4987]
MRILNKLTDYRDLKDMSRGALDFLCQDIREEIIRVVTKNGGHLASSLGAVELIVALLRQFNPLEDRIIFDVGHQAYAYKILTDRKDQFATLRQWGGISGFPKREESPCDHFNVGHSSTSLSAALGYCKARDIQNQKHHVVAVIGDGALLNGLSFEALNYTKDAHTKVIYILNDNKMSIGHRVGGFASHLAKLSSSQAYNSLKKYIKESCASIPQGQSIENVLAKFKDHIKSLVKPDNIFDELDINYWGPFDGHNIEEMETVLKMAKSYHKSVLIHVVTKKGKGLPCAEEHPDTYHGVPVNGFVKKTTGTSWSASATEVLCSMAEKDSRIVCLTAAMKNGTRLDEFALRFPDRFFDVGIAEEHMFTMAAGMAAGGLRPVVFIYSTFLQRAMDQLAHDIALQDLPVVIAVDRGGLVGEDGETHQGLFDIAWCKTIPNVNMLIPRDRIDLEKAFQFGLAHHKPTIIRYSRGIAPEAIIRHETTPALSPFQSEILMDGKEWTLIGMGATIDLCLKSRERAIEEGVPAPSVMDLRCAKPLDWTTLDKTLQKDNLVIILEEGYKFGGVGEAIASRSAEFAFKARVLPLGIPDLFVPHGTPAIQREFCGLTYQRVVNCYKEETQRKSR